jgi:uncharacterized membrane protein
MNTAYIYLYLATVPVFFAMDMLWLGVVARTTYVQYLGYLMRTPIMWSAALIFYFLFLVGLLYFSVIPGLQNGTLLSVAISGALFGFFTYATYDLTNLATIRDWPLFITIIDMIWGTVLSASVASISYLIGKNFLSL